MRDGCTFHNSFTAYASHVPGTEMCLSFSCASLPPSTLYDLFVSLFCYFSSAHNAHSAGNQ